MSKIKKDRVFISGSVVEASPIELFGKSVERVTATTGKGIRTVLDMGNNNPEFPKRWVDFSWLKAASKVYDISPNIKDYIAVAVGVVSADIPNRNGQAFSSADLVSFDPDLGRMKFQSFIGKPTHIDHNNLDKKQAKGVNFDSILVPVVGYNLHKVVVLSAFDRTKDEKLCQQILTRERRAYSMGALAGYFICSICNGVLGPAVRRTCTCTGVEFSDLRTLGKVVGGVLQYHLAKDFTYIENSSVLHPADISAVGKML